MSSTDPSAVILCMLWLSFWAEGLSFRAHPKYVLCYSGRSEESDVKDIIGLYENKLNIK